MGSAPHSRPRDHRPGNDHLPAPPAGSNGEQPGRRGPAPLASDSFLRPSFTLEQLRTFLAVASREHVTQAAKVLRLSQPAVTQQVQLLERALGVRLLERIGRRVRLTDAGVEVASACLLVMRSLEQVGAVARAARGLDIGSVTVAVSQLAADYLLPPVLADFIAVHPRIDVCVSVTGSEQVHDDVAAGQADCGLVDGPPPPPEFRLTSEEVATSEVVVVVHPRDVPDPRPELPNGIPTSMHYLDWGPGSATEALVAQLVDEVTAGLPHLQLGSMEAARRLMLSRPGFVTAMPRIAVREELGSGALVTLCRHPDPLPVFAVRRQGPDSPAVEALWRALSRPAGAAAG
jgi:DNA-binding transcriptional LysR family regulator